MPPPRRFNAADRLRFLGVPEMRRVEELGLFHTVQRELERTKAVPSSASIPFAVALGAAPFGFHALVFFLPAGTPWWLRGTLMIAWAGCIAGLVLLGRGSTRRRYRTAMARVGIPICVGCGYDLEGVQAPQCPECGCVKEHRPSEQ